MTEDKHTIDSKVAVNLLWQEWKYRHDLLWKMLFRWAGAVVTLWIIPFLKPEVFNPFPLVALAFPIIALVLSILSAWHLAGEQYRFNLVNAKYRELRGHYAPKAGEAFRDKFFAIPIGAAMVWVYGVAFALISALDIYLLLQKAAIEAPACN